MSDRMLKEKYKVWGSPAHLYHTIDSSARQKEHGSFGLAWEWHHGEICLPQLDL
jgi:hypothetical protein